MASASEHWCSLCQEDDSSVMAVTWCPDCETFLCPDCNHHHGRNKSSKNHKTVPAQDYIKLPTSILTTQNHCADHDLKYELFCTFHDTPCCTKCLVGSHNNCQGVVHLADATKDIKSSAVTSNLKRDVSILNVNIDKIEKYLHSRKSASDNQKQKGLKEVERWRKSVNEHLDNIEKKAVEDLDAAHANIISKTKETLEKVKEHKKHIQTLQDDMTQTTEFATELQTFLGIRNIETIISQEATYLETLQNSGELDELYLDMEISSCWTSFLAELNYVGNISVSTEVCKLQLETREGIQVQLSRGTIEEIKPTLKKKLILPKNGVTTGCTILPDGQLLFAHQGTKRLILYSSEGVYCKDVIIFPKEPFDICYIKNHTVAVTIPEMRVVILLDLNDNAMMKTISLKDTCYGISSDGKEILVRLSDKNLIMVLDDKGKELRRLKIQGYHSIYLEYFEQRIFCTNYNENSVYCYSNHSDKLWLYQDEDIQKPRGLNVEKKGIVYLACTGSDKIVIISPDGKKSRTLLSSSDGLICPYSLTIDRTKSVLLVWNMKDDSGFLYKI